MRSLILRYELFQSPSQQLVILREEGVLDRVDPAIRDNEDSRYTLYVVHSGQATVIILKNGVGDVYGILGRIADVDGGETYPRALEVLGQPGEVWLGLVAVSVQGVPEGQHVDAPVGEVKGSASFIALVYESRDPIPGVRGWSR
ncbi:MAG: hypothetical protein QOI57_1938 [Rubrobacteraceae bacterium]|nr:hypothetical protein [Rubrobacteraceae bacterium]